MTFEQFLTSKRIDPLLFQQGERDMWDSWRCEFEQLHPASFTAQKLYLINKIRRKFSLKAIEPSIAPPPLSEGEVKGPSSKPMTTGVRPPKPIIRPKIN